MSYRVKIENFDGPFELLLSLVSRDKVDIGSISITEISGRDIPPEDIGLECG